MASTSKTQNLKLNQWVLDDPFLMADMNADNLKIDTAVHGLESRKAERVLLKDITTTVQANEMEIDVTDIDWGQYSAVFVHWHLQGYGSLNLTALPCNDQNYWSTQKYGSIGGALSYMICDDVNTLMVFMPFKNPSTRVAALAWVFEHGTIYAGRAMQEYKNITKLKIGGNEGSYLKPNSKIRMWGMK